MDATTTFFDMINDYCGPLLLAAGYRISPQGFIEDDKGNKLFYQNPKYIEGTKDPQNPPFLYPVVPIDERSYLNIKATPEFELFNPFQNYKHACIVLFKLKNLLIPFYVPDEKLNEVDEEDIDATFGDCFQIYNRKDNTGAHEVGIVDIQDPQNPKELMKYASDEITKSVWGLAVMIYNNFCATKPLKQFKNIDRGWNKTQKLCEEWNKARAGLMQQVRIEQENVLNPDMVDYTNGMDDKTVDMLPFTVENYVDMKDCSDINDPGLQDYLTNMFPKEQLVPYVEPEPDDESAELEVSDSITVPDTLSMPEEVFNPPVEEDPEMVPVDSIESEEDLDNFDNMKPVEEVVDNTPPVVEEKPVVRDNHSAGIGSNKGSVFSFGSAPTAPVQQRPMGFGMNPMMGNMGMGYGMNPMMGMGMGMPNMMGGMQQMPQSNLDDMNLSNSVDPFAPYR